MNSINEKTTTIQKHYQQVASTYDESWEYSEDFINFSAEKIIKYLNLNSKDLFVDLGCGTGIYTKKIRDLINFNKEIICVDTSSEMLKQIPQNQKFNPIKLDAIEFSKLSYKYDKVLMQYMIHHIKNKDELVFNLYQKLNTNGQILIIRLGGKIDHPLFVSAKERYETEYKTSDKLIQSMKNAGFKTNIETIDYQVVIEKEKYFKMIEKKYMSILSSFTDREIQKGIQEIEKKYSQTDKLVFPEHILFILGQK